MPIERMTTVKINVSDVINGKWVQKEGMEPSFIETSIGNVSRAKFLGTVVEKFISEDGNFGSLTLDDSTDTIRAKAFKDMASIEGFDIGDLVDVIGKIREYNGEIYMIPEVIVRVEPNMELLRRLELIKSYKGKKATSGEIVTADAGSEEVETKQQTGKPEQKEGAKEVDKDILRKDIIKIIESAPEGIDYNEIIKKSGAAESVVETIVNEILSEGICYEPTPGKIRKI